MGWQKVDALGRSAVKERVTFGIVRSTHSAVVLRISVGMMMMRMMGWERGQRVDVLWGEGKDFGWLRLDPQPDGFKLGRTGKSEDCACVLSTSQIHRSGRSELHSPAVCKWRIREGGLELLAPSWFWADDNLPTRTRKSSPTRTTTTTPTTATAIN